MKLPIKKKFFEQIMENKKEYEYRDAHLTLICEETGEKLIVLVEKCDIIDRTDVPAKYRDVLTSERVIRFQVDTSRRIKLGK